MNIRFYLHQSRRYVLCALIPAILAAGLAYTYTKGQPRTYSATATLFVQMPTSTSSGTGVGTDVVGSTLLTPTYSQMVADPVIYAAVDRMMKWRFPGYRVEQHGVSTNQKPGANTALIKISVTDTIPARAAAAANAVAQAFVQRIQGLQAARFSSDTNTLEKQVQTERNAINQITQQMNSGGGNPGLRATLAAHESTLQTLLASLAQFKVASDAASTSVNVYSSAVPPTAPIGPHPTRTAAVIAVIVLILGLGGIKLYEYLDDSLSSPEEVEQIVGAPILGTVQAFNAQKLGSRIVTMAYPRSPLAEAYRLIRTNVQFTNIDNPPRTILVTSSSPAEGKSTTASNLAHVFAEGGQRVTLVDCDLRRPSLHRVFSTGGGPGLTSMLVSEHLNGHAAHQVGNGNLFVIAAGPVPPNPADLLASQRMHSVVDHIREQAEIVLLDSPPVLAVSDSAVLATMVDGVVLVVDPNKTKRHELRRAREALDTVGGKILGVVVNRVSPRGAGYYYYYYYQYTYGQKYGYVPESPRSQSIESSTSETRERQRLPELDRG